jgi:catechol 2,3-dioxygenase-like lactoylglutathione lyase family enzyme
MQGPEGVQVLFVTGFGPIVRDDAASRRFYADVLKLPLKDQDGYLHATELDGVKHFGLWRLSDAAQSVFGTSEWPKDVPVPQGGIEFDVEDVAKATAELKAKGYRLLVENRTEPWGQVVTRCLSPEGLLVGLVYTPWMREKK